MIERSSAARRNVFGRGTWIAIIVAIWAHQFRARQVSGPVITKPSLFLPLPILVAMLAPIAEEEPSRRPESLRAWLKSFYIFAKTDKVLNVGLAQR